MLELLISILYVAWGIVLFKIDINHDLSGLLSFGCFEGAGFNLLFIFYAALSPIVMVSIVYTQFKRLLNYLFKN
jgi:hypothetical protein